MEKQRSEHGTMTVGQLRAVLNGIPESADDKPVWLDLDDDWGSDLCEARAYGGGALYLQNYDFNCCEDCG